MYKEQSVYCPHSPTNTNTSTNHHTTQHTPLTVKDKHVHTLNHVVADSHSLYRIFFNCTECEASAVTWFGSHVPILGSFPPHICESSAVRALQRDFPSEIGHLFGVRDAVKVPHQDLGPRVALHMLANFNHRSTKVQVWNEVDHNMKQECMETLMAEGATFNFKITFVKEQGNNSCSC